MNKAKLFQKDFILVVIGQIISLFGNSILRFALPLYLLRKTSSAYLFGMVTAFSFLPMIMLSLLGGVLADRFNKRNVMVGLDFFTAILTFFLSIVLDRLPLVPLLIVALMLLNGIQGAYQPVVQASIPLVVFKERLVTANAVINQVHAMANLLGPILGGILFSEWGIIPIFHISGICIIIAAVMEIFIYIPHNREKSQDGVLDIVVGDLKDSFRYMRREKPIYFSLMSLISLFNLFLSSMIIVGVPVLIIETLTMDDTFFGYSQGMLAAGGLIGGIFMGVYGEKMDLKKSYLLILTCALGVLPTVVVLIFEVPLFISYIIITAMGFILMLISTMFTVQIMAFVQEQTPTELVGKVISFFLSFSICALPIGQALYGILFEYLVDELWIVVLVTALISFAISIYSKKIFSSLKE